MSIYEQFSEDFKCILSDIGVEVAIGSERFLGTLSAPMMMQSFEAGGFVDNKTWKVELAAQTAPWKASDGRVGASVATIVNGDVIQALGIGKIISCNGQSLRIKGTSHQRGYFSITLDCCDPNE